MSCFHRSSAQHIISRPSALPDVQQTVTTTSGGDGNICGGGGGGGSVIGGGSGVGNDNGCMSGSDKLGSIDRGTE